jgi:lipoate-protein ligase A
MSADSPLHGEYKVPGGKLVVVDLTIDDDRIASIRIAGDFFVEPDETVHEMERAVLGMRADSDAVALTRALTDAVPAGAQLLGFSPEAVATTIRRAVNSATTFADHEWQLLRGPALKPVQQMATDQVLTEEVGAGRRGPTLRIWEWASPAVVIGSFQSVKNEVDLDNAEKFGFEVVRRVSGGGAMFIEPQSAITYSLYAPVDLVKGMSFAESYAFLDSWVLTALHDLGIDASYVPLNDIASPAGKIGGAAQKRLGAGAVLHHTTMAYDMDGDRMTQVLRIGREKLSDKGIASANKRVDPLKSQTGMTRDAIIDSLVGTFDRLYGLSEGAITDDESARVEQLVAEKFGTHDWVHRVP